VGLADDILDVRSIFDDVAQGVEIIVKDLQEDYLAKTIAPQYERVTAHHSTESIRDKLQSIYTDWRSLPVYQSQPVVRKQKTRFQRRFEKALRLIMPNRSVKFSVGLWHKFFKPPYGGGNQFLLALRKSLQGRGIHIVENELGMGIDSYLLNSVHFDIEKFSRAHKKDMLPIVHRIDGPISLIRGFDKEKDDLAFELNQKLASSTVLQSFWSYERILEMGYRPVKPVIVHNAVDPDIFHSNNRISFDRTRKIRIISSSWSDNPRKGGAIYKWIEENLDWERFEYTFVGRASEKFNRIHQIEPVSSAELAGLLRQHDIYITASQNDPCSNALIEALACGLPALYLNDGGHPELVQFGGLPFSGTQDVLQQLDRIVDHYELFQRIISIPTMDSVANTYLSLLRDAANGKS
jgi:glycosyltransferase involved in cell wall biosynthesis